MRPKARYRCASTDPAGWDGPSSKALRTSSSRHDYNCVGEDLARELNHILQPRRHLHGTRRPPRAAPTSADESGLFGRPQGRRAPSAPRESVCLGPTHHFPFLGFPAGHPRAILAPWADRPLFSFSQLSRLQQRLGIGAEIGSVALDLAKPAVVVLYLRRCVARELRSVVTPSHRAKNLGGSVGCRLWAHSPIPDRSVQSASVVRGNGGWTRAFNPDWPARETTTLPID